MMKNTKKPVLAVLLAALLFAVTACGATDTDDLWQNADYRTDTTLGSGATEIAVEVRAGEREITFTVKTDAPTLGAALLACGLIAGEEGPYGLYVKSVNGITADYDVDFSYWAFYENGALAPVGVDAAEIENGGHYELVYTK